MKTDEFVGNKQVYNFLTNSWKNNALNHAYLLIGALGIGKYTLVKHFVKSLLCEQGKACGKCQSCLQVEAEQHPDVWLVKKESGKQDIAIEQVRQLQHFVSLGSLSGSWRVVIVDGAHFLNAESGNALLKSLEEPAANVVFFLLSAEPKKILPTIKSRCFVLQFGLVPAAEIKDFLTSKKISDKEALDLANLAGGRPGVAINLLNQPDELEQKISQAELFLSLLKVGGFTEVVKYFENQFKDSTSEASLNRQQALDLISVWRIMGRDLLCYKIGLNQFIRYQVLDSKLDLAEKLSLKVLWGVGKLLQEAESRLMSNSHTRLTLEWLAYSINRLVI